MNNTTQVIESNITTATEANDTVMQPVDFSEGISNEIEHLGRLYDTVIDFFVNYSFHIVGALIVLLIGFFVAGKAGQYLEKALISKNFDVTLSKFTSNFVRIAIIIGVVVIALGKLGVQITPFVAALGAAGLGAGLALQGTLSNFGAGLSIIATKTFKVGDTISVMDKSGLVKEIKLGYTILVTEDLEEITIPNKHIVGEILVNSFDHRIVEAVVGIDYANDPKVAIAAIKEVLGSFEEVATDPKAQVGIKEFGDSSVNIEYRYWAPTDRYFQTQYKINLAIFEALNKENITIPFPILTVLQKESTN